MVRLSARYDGLLVVHLTIGNKRIVFVLDSCKKVRVIIELVSSEFRLLVAGVLEELDRTGSRAFERRSRGSMSDRGRHRI